VAGEQFSTFSLLPQHSTPAYLPRHAAPLRTTSSSFCRLALLRLRAMPRSPATRRAGLVHSHTAACTAALHYASLSTKRAACNAPGARMRRILHLHYAAALLPRLMLYFARTRCTRLPPPGVWANATTRASRTFRASNALHRMPQTATFACHFYLPAHPVTAISTRRRGARRMVCLRHACLYSTPLPVRSRRFSIPHYRCARARLTSRGRASIVPYLSTLRFRQTQRADGTPATLTPCAPTLHAQVILHLAASLPPLRSCASLSSAGIHLPPIH